MALSIDTPSETWKECAKFNPTIKYSELFVCYVPHGLHLSES